MVCGTRVHNPSSMVVIDPGSGTSTIEITSQILFCDIFPGTNMVSVHIMYCSCIVAQNWYSLRFNTKPTPLKISLDLWVLVVVENRADQALFVSIYLSSQKGT